LARELDFTPDIQILDIFLNIRQRENRPVISRLDSPQTKKSEITIEPSFKALLQANSESVSQLNRPEEKLFWVSTTETFRQGLHAKLLWLITPLNNSLQTAQSSWKGDPRPKMIDNYIQELIANADKLPTPEQYQHIVETNPRVTNIEDLNHQQLYRQAAQIIATILNPNSKNSLKDW
jgi:hypothetical protein